MRNLILFLVLLLSTYCYCEEENVEAEVDTSKYHRAQVESCPGCSLNRLKEVKAFVYDDVPKYHNVDFKKIQGAPPELVFFDKDDQEIERISLKGLTREQCNYELVSRGFLLKLAARTRTTNEEL